MLRTTLIALSAAAAACSFAAPASAGIPGLPPKGKILLGVGGARADLGEYKAMTGRKHHIHMVFLGWGQGVNWGGDVERWLEKGADGNYRLMFHLGTDRSGTQAITPQQIANGAGDDYIVGVSRAANESGQVVYIRPMAEMNGHWNHYSAYNPNGSSRGASHSTANYRKAFKRLAIVMRGGSVAAMNTRLAKARMPKLRTSSFDLPSSGKVAMVWNPQGEGNPNRAGNQPKDYYPGGAFVDYVANDMYSIRFRAHWPANERLYNAFPGKPFMMAEWAPWGTDDPAFTSKMFKWAASHPRTKALIYFHGNGSNLFQLNLRPRTKAVYRAAVRTQSRYNHNTGAY